MRRNYNIIPPVGIERDCPRCDKPVSHPGVDSNDRHSPRSIDCPECGITLKAVTRGGDRGWAWEPTE